MTHLAGVKYSYTVWSEDLLLLCSQLYALKSVGVSHMQSWCKSEESGPSSLCRSADPALSTVAPCTVNAWTCKHKREDWPSESSFLSFDLSKPFILPLLPLVLCLIFLTSLCNLDLVTIHKASEGKWNLWRGCFPLPNHLQHYPSLFLVLWFLTLIFLPNCHQVDSDCKAEMGRWVSFKNLHFFGTYTAVIHGLLICGWMSYTIDSLSPLPGCREDNKYHTYTCNFCAFYHIPI